VSSHALTPATDFIAPPAQVAELTRSPDNAAFVEQVCALAKQHDIWVSVGVHEPPEMGEPTRCYNTHLLVNAEGQICERYRKVGIPNS